MLSVPPARTIRASPVRMVRAAESTDWRPEAHAWLTGSAAGLPAMAEDDLVDLIRIEAGPFQRGLGRRRAEVGRGERGEGAAELADGRPHWRGEDDVVVLLRHRLNNPSITPELGLTLADVGVEAFAGV